MRKYIFLFIAVLPLLASCDLMQGDGDNDPNVNENTFLQSDNAMEAWVNGTEMQLSQAVGSYVQLLEIASDNYYNQYSRSSNVFDQPMFLNTDDDVKDLQRWVGTLRESANYAFDVVAKHDSKLTPQQTFKLHWIKGYSFILGGETFTGLPLESGGEVKPWKDMLNEAAAILSSAREEAATDSDKALVNTLLARAYYRLGDRTKAVTYAKTALENGDDFVKFVYYDGSNNVANIGQEAIWDNWFQPLPRLDFLDPKYFKTFATEERPIAIAKAEEDYLILAEAAVADGDLSIARTYLHRLVKLVNSRPTMKIIDANCDLFNHAEKPYPMTADYRVRASENDPYRTGLVQTRTDSTYVTVPIISGTSVNDEMIESAADADDMLELVYLMRQEIFLAEGRRAADLGLRLPVCDVEAANTASAEGYTEASIPPFIPLKGEMDNFDLDAQAKTVTIHYNMNRVIVENKNTQYVAPFN